MASIHNSGIGEHENTPLIDQPDTRFESKHTKPYTKLVVLLYLFILVVDFGGILQIAPMTEIFEGIICRDYYAGPHSPADNVDDGQLLSCKIPPVQKEIAFLYGIQNLLQILPSLFYIYPSMHATNI